jgi:hypothetical protein
MRLWLFNLAGIVFLTGCSSPPPPPAARQPSNDAAIADQLQDRWNQCLSQSYQITRTKTDDKNAAAEMAFQDCQTEEQDLASLPYEGLIFPHLKSATKQVLIETGHVARSGS